MKLPNLKYNPKYLASDITAGITTAMVTILDGLASAILTEERLGVSTLSALSSARSWLDRQDNNDNETN
jgi:hypothetical protein